MSLIKHIYTSSVEKHVLANQKVRGSVRQSLVFVVLYEFTRLFTQKSQGETRVKNTRGTPEMELTESRV